MGLRRVLGETFDRLFKLLVLLHVARTDEPGEHEEDCQERERDDDDLVAQLLRLGVWHNRESTGEETEVEERQQDEEEEEGGVESAARVVQLVVRRSHVEEDGEHRGLFLE